MNRIIDNVLVRLVDSGRIKSFGELKSAYHTLVVKTHPDATGSDRHLEQYLELNNHYEAAKKRLKELDGEINDRPAAVSSRLTFFKHLNLIETLEAPYAFHPHENEERLRLAKKEAMAAFADWQGSRAALYEKADREYVDIKREKPSGPYLKNAMALNIRPLVHNIVSYHLTGRELYAKQARQNLPAIMHRLTQKGCISLRDFLSFLLGDLANGAAILD
jgi:hypothetical protein